MALIEQETSAQLPIADAIRLGDAELALEARDTDAVVELAREKYTLVQGFQSDAVAHFYRKLGYTETEATELFDFVLKFLALSAAAHELNRDEMLSMPERADNDGWHGFIIQTRDYAAACDQLGTFIHHATTARGQGEAVTRTLALMTRAFGPVTEPVWADCPGCIIYGWCSSGTD